MPRYEITSPDGKRFEINAPEGATEDQALAYAQQQFRARSELRAKHDAETARQANPAGSFGENLVAGAGKAFVDLGRGARQIASKVGIGDERAIQAEIDEARELEKPLMKTAGGVVGNVAGSVALAVPTMAIPGAGTYLGATAVGSALGALQPVATGESRMLNTAVGGAAGAGGKLVGDKVAGVLAKKLAGKEAGAVTSQAQNAGRDATLSTAREAGYVVPPAQSNPTLVNQAVEGFSGKIKTGQVASVRNQKVTNDLVKKALGVTDEGPLTRETLTGIRSEAGRAYEALRGVGTINADKQFISDLGKITAKFEGAAKDFPDLAKNEIGEIVASVNKPTFSADSAIDAISILRDRAAAAYSKGDRGLGSAYKQTSQAMEDAIERNLIESGNQATLKAFQAARKVIAKTYSVENALNSSGNVNAQKLAQQLKKGKPLSDELRTVAEFADQFPKAAQNVDQLGSVSGVSPLDYMAGMGLSTIDLGLGAASVAARPLVRSMALSPVYQRLMGTQEYGAGKGLKMLSGAANNARLRALLPLGSAAAAVQE